MASGLAPALSEGPEGARAGIALRSGETGAFSLSPSLDGRASSVRRPLLLGFAFGSGEWGGVLATASLVDEAGVFACSLR